jgi:hypothetical protein
MDFKNRKKKKNFFVIFDKLCFETNETDYLLENFFSELEFYEMKSHDDRHYKSVS